MARSHVLTEKESLWLLVAARAKSKAILKGIEAESIIGMDSVRVWKSWNEHGSHQETEQWDSRSP